MSKRAPITSKGRGLTPREAIADSLAVWTEHAGGHDPEGLPTLVQSADLANTWADHRDRDDERPDLVTERTHMVRWDDEAHDLPVGADTGRTVPAIPTPRQREARAARARRAEQVANGHHVAPGSLVGPDLRPWPTAPYHDPTARAVARDLDRSRSWRPRTSATPWGDRSDVWAPADGPEARGMVRWTVLATGASTADALADLVATHRAGSTWGGRRGGPLPRGRRSRSAILAEREAAERRQREAREAHAAEAARAMLAADRIG